MTMTDMTTHEPRSQMAARRARGLIAEMRLRQETLALAIGMSQGYFSRKVNGRTPFTVDEIAALAFEIGVSEAYLYGFTEDRSRSDVDDIAPRVGLPRVIANRGTVVDLTARRLARDAARPLPAVAREGMAAVYFLRPVGRAS